MQKLQFLISLVTRENDYQLEQAAAAQAAAECVGAGVEILYANNDAIQQSQQLLRAIQSRSSPPNGIIFESAGATGFPQVAKAAVQSGIAWVVLNREVTYITELRRQSKTPIFAVSSDHQEIGRIQGQQIAALLPQGGSALVIQGPPGTTAAQRRMTGLNETSPTNVQLRKMKADWTEAGAYKTVGSWLQLSTSMQTRFDLVVSQNDAMAMGARRAFQNIFDITIRNRFADLLYLGVDGVAGTGQAWLGQGLLNSTIVVPPNTGIAIELLASAIRTGVMPPEKTFTTPRSLPSLDELVKSRRKRFLTAAR